MIKFYKDSYANLKAKDAIWKSANAICFATDRNVITISGALFGRDVGSVFVDVGATSGTGRTLGPTGARLVGPTGQQSDTASGAIYAQTANNSLWRYDGSSTWTNIITGTVTATEYAVGNAAGGYLSTAVSGGYIATIDDVNDVAFNLEAKVSGAYNASTAKAASDVTNDNTIIVSQPSGLARSEYKLDNGTNIAKTTGTGTTAKNQTVEQLILDTSIPASDKDELSAFIPNAQTLAAVYEEVNKSAVEMAPEAGNFITWDRSPSTDLTGTTWTPVIHLTSGTVSSALKYESNGELGIHLAIRQKTTNTGYLATYALYNEAEGQANGVQCGEDINLVKDQFLKQAEYVRAIPSGTGYLELTQVTSENLTNVIQILNNAPFNANIPTNATVEQIQSLTGDTAYGNSFNRYLKLTFALTKTDNENQDTLTGGSQTGTDADSIVYIDVNELFDSYYGVSGVTVNPTTNQISAQVKPGTEVGYSAADKKGVKGTHYGATAYLTNSAAGLSVDGIKQDISASIEDLDNGLAATANTWMTSVGVDNGRLTASYLSAYTSGINFNGVAGSSVLLPDNSNVDYQNINSKAIAIPSTTYKTANEAISAIAVHIGALDYVYDGDKLEADGGNKPAGSDTLFIYRIEQKDGLISAAAKALDSSNLKVTAHTTPALARNTQQIYTVAKDTSTKGSLQDGLNTIVESVSTTVQYMSAAVAGTKSTLTNYAAGSATTQTPYTVINQIDLVNGVISTNTFAVDAANITFTPIAAVAGRGEDARIDLKTLDSLNTVYAKTVYGAIESLDRYIAKLDTLGNTSLTKFDGTATAAGQEPFSGHVGTTGTVTYTKPDATSITYNNTLNDAYIITRGVSQTDGQLSAVSMTLTDANVYTAGIAETATGASTSVKAPIASGNIHNSLDSIANLIADYCSFHDANGAVI